MDFAKDMCVPDTRTCHTFQECNTICGVNWKPSIELASSFGLGGCPVEEGVSG